MLANVLLLPAKPLRQAIVLKTLKVGPKARCVEQLVKRGREVGHDGLRVEVHAALPVCRAVLMRALIVPRRSPYF